MNTQLSILIVDDVRTGFRIDLKGSHNAFGFSPDLVCLGKAMANGYPISALVGKASLKDAANKVYFSGTQFFNSAPMAASKATLEELQNLNAVEIMNTNGLKLKDDLSTAAKTFGLEINVSGITLGFQNSMFLKFAKSGATIMQHRLEIASSENSCSFLTSPIDNNASNMVL